MDDEQLSREIRNEIEKATGAAVDVSIEDRVVHLAGRFPSNESVVDAGHIAGEFDQVREVVNDIDFPGKQPLVLPERHSAELDGKEYDVVIVGAGVIGLAVARALSRYNLTVAVVERHHDLGMDQTLHSNAMVHPATTAEYGTLKWEMNYRGNAMWDNVAEQLGLGFRRIGTLIVAENEVEESFIPHVFEVARKHNDPPPRELGRGELDDIEPGLAANVQKGVLLVSTGIIEVFDLIVAYAENAMANGVHFYMNTSVIGVQTQDRSVRAVDTTRGTVRTRLLVNAAGLYSDKVAELAGDRFFTIHPRKGETVIFDKSYRPVRTVLATFGMLTARKRYSKGGGIIPTVDGNLTFGPTAEEVCAREDFRTTSAGLDTLFGRFAPMLERLKPGYDKPEKGKIIAHFAGCRAATYREDFIIEPSRKVRGLVHAAGIQSPGLASAPAIADRVVEIIVDSWHPEEKAEYDPGRKKGKRFADMDARERDEAIRANPLYGHILCRCEHVTEGEVLDALHNDVRAPTVDAVKRRTRAGMGRCQGGFCMPRVLEVISGDTGIDKVLVTKSDGRSYILGGRTKRVGK